MQKEQILKELKKIANKDEDYLLDIEGWYYRIKHSTGPYNSIAKQHDIPTYLVTQIKMQEEK